MAALLPIIGAALSLTGAHAHNTSVNTVTPAVASRGQTVRVTLPNHSPPTEGLKARIRVAGTTTAERPTRATHRYIWLPVDVPESTGTAAARPSGLIEAQLILTSSGRRILDTDFELKAGSPPGLTTAAPAAESVPPQPPTSSPSTSPPASEPAAGGSDGSAAPEPPGAVTTGPEPPGVTSPTPSAPEGQTPLSWPPAALTKPTVVTVPSGRDPAVLRLNTSRDYIVQLPPEGIHGTVEINGGHNIVLDGGEITVPSTANQTDNGADDTDTALYVRASTGTVHIEGVLIRGEPGVMFDGIDVNAPQATVQVENVRMEDIYGASTSEHADMIQTWGGVKELDVDGLTANGDYQGLTIAPALGTVETVHIENVDMTAEAAPPSMAATAAGGGIMLWLTRGKSTCESATITLQDVYLANLTHRILSANTAWPSSLSGLSCDSVSDGTTITWPGLPVSGGVTIGTPPHGPFVPEGVAGNDYHSPGYQPS